MENAPENNLPRLQKALAAAGVASRRACETLIAAGRVAVNGKTVREMGTKVDPERDEVRVDGEPVTLTLKQKPVYLMLNKPVGYASTVSDPYADHTVMELVSDVHGRLYPVGRLDVDSAGLLLLTNDGEFANRMTHPRYHIPKLYRVRVRGFVGRETARQLMEGIDLPDGRTAPADLAFVDYDTATQCSLLDMTLYEGRNRQVRRMMETVGHPVRELTRIAFGKLKLGSLNLGTYRRLSPTEVDTLLDMAQAQPTPPKSERRLQPVGPYRPRNAGNVARQEEDGRQETEDRKQSSSAFPNNRIGQARSNPAPSPPSFAPRSNGPNSGRPNAPQPRSNNAPSGPRPFSPPPGRPVFNSDRPNAAPYNGPRPNMPASQRPNPSYDRPSENAPRPNGNGPRPFTPSNRPTPNARPGLGNPNPDYRRPGNGDYDSRPNGNVPRSNASSYGPRPNVPRPNGQGPTGAGQNGPRPYGSPPRPSGNSPRPNAAPYNGPRPNATPYNNPRPNTANTNNSRPYGNAPRPANSSRPAPPRSLPPNVQMPSYEAARPKRPNPKAGNPKPQQGAKPRGNGR